MTLFSMETQLSPISLPAPAKTNDSSVFSAFGRRRTTREIGGGEIPLQIVANLLWAAFGINRPIGPYGLAGRTAASASNSQEIDLYVAFQQGVYLYDPAASLLRPVLTGDLRHATLRLGQHSVDAIAPLVLIYIADIYRLTATRGYKDVGLEDPQTQRDYCCVDAGMIAANAYLYAAAEGLAAWFHNCDRDRLGKALSLRPLQRVLFAQSIGYPDSA